MFRVRSRSLSFVSMPTYDYRCPNGHDFEHFYRKISDATAELTCPECGAVAARRVSGGAGLVFKGSGFYLTDYGKNAHRKSGSSGSDGASSGGESSGESKSASKSEAAKSDGGSSATSESSASPAKPESTKSADKPSSTTKPSSGDSK